MLCLYCSASCKKKGRYKKVQLYQCCICKKYQRSNYSYKKVNEEDLQKIVEFNNEGLGIRSISRILKLSPSTVQRKIILIAKSLNKPVLSEKNQTYEVDEMCTYINKNLPSNYIYISYAINKKTKQVLDFVIGTRSKLNFQPLINNILALSPRVIYTDRLKIYSSLIPDYCHRSYRYCTNRIERFNLTLRMHLKRLNRKTLSYNKSILMLGSCLKIYFWGNNPAPNR